VLTLGLMLSEGIKVSNSTVEMAEADEKTKKTQTNWQCEKNVRT